MDKYKKVELKELLTENGYVVTIEGDEDLYNNDLAEWLKKYCKNYKLLNNIYEEPKKLLQLKDINIDVFVFQTTGLHPKLPKLIDLYIDKVGNYPKHFITVNKDGEKHFEKIFKQMDSYNLYRYRKVDKDRLYLIKQDHACKEKE